MADSEKMIGLEPTKENIARAIQTLAQFDLQQRIDHLQGTSGTEKSRIIAAVWPVIREIVVLANACEEGLLQKK